MSQVSQNSQRLLLALLASMTSLFWGALTAPGLAQWNRGTYQPPPDVGVPERTQTAGTRAWNGEIYRPSSGIGTPTRSQSGGTRATRGCPITENSPSVVAVVPNNNFGVTLKSHPTFLFYLPAITPGATPPPVEFVIRDLDDNDIYKVRFTTNGRGGIASITLPESSGVKGLELNQGYTWSVAMICQMNDRGSDIVTAGLIQRVAVPPELAPSVLQSMSVVERAELLGSAGIWYDAVALLAELQRNQPLPQWTNILQAVDLLDLVNQPLLDGRNSAVPNPTTLNP